MKLITSGTVFDKIKNMKSLLLCLICLPWIGFSQNPHQQKADSIMICFFGSEIFNRFVTNDPDKNTQQSHTTHSTLYYSFNHPKFSGRVFSISFSLDSLGKLIVDEKTHGLIKPDPSNDSSWISAKQALDICRGQSHRVKKHSLRLSWEQTNVSYDIFKQTHDYRDIVPGELVWEVDGIVEFRGDRYSGTFKINVFTGSVARHFAIPWD
jgi:hypothetical protein